MTSTKKGFYKEDKLVKTQVRKDSWENFLSGISGVFDKTRHNEISTANFLSYFDLASGYADGGWIHKIVKVIANDMTRKWITLDKDPELKITNKIKDLDVVSIWNQAIKWRRLFGGALVVMLSGDGDLENPMKKNAEIKQLRVYSAAEVDIDSSVFDVKPSSLTYGEVIKYRIKPDNTVMGFDVHASRCIPFKGIPLPKNCSIGMTTSLKYWGMGNIQPIFNQLSNLGVFEQSMGNLSQELIVSIYRIAGLADMIATNTEEGLAKAQTRMMIMNQTKSSLHGVFLDASMEESYDKVATNLNGIPELWDRFVMALSGVSEIPVTKLTGRSAAGENATGEGDIQNYYDDVAAEQENIMRKTLNKLLFKLNNDTFVSFHFNPLYEHTQKDQIEMKYKQAQSDKIYYDMQVLSAEEIRQNRFENGFSFETSVDSEEDIEEIDEIEE